MRVYRVCMRVVDTFCAFQGLRDERLESDFKLV